MELAIIIIILLLTILIILAFFAGKSIGKRYMFEVMQKIIEEERKDAIKRSRSVLTGQFSEQIAPLMPNFPAKASECRFIGKPVDFIAFKGLDEKNIEEVIFIEVKTGNSKMNQTERSLKEVIEQKKVKFVEYRVKE